MSRICRDDARGWWYGLGADVVWRIRPPLEGVGSDSVETPSSVEKPAFGEFIDAIGTRMDPFTSLPRAASEPGSSKSAHEALDLAFDSEKGMLVLLLPGNRLATTTLSSGGLAATTPPTSELDAAGFTTTQELPTELVAPRRSPLETVEGSELWESQDLDFREPIDRLLYWPNAHH